MYISVWATHWIFFFFHYVSFHKVSVRYFIKMLEISPWLFPIIPFQRYCLTGTNVHRSSLALLFKSCGRIYAFCFVLLGKGPFFCSRLEKMLTEWQYKGKVSVEKVIIVTLGYIMCVLIRQGFSVSSWIVASCDPLQKSQVCLQLSPGIYR